jgi:predicted CopG family antitoxin
LNTTTIIEKERQKYNSVALRPEIYLKLVSVTPKNKTFSEAIDELLEYKIQVAATK